MDKMINKLNISITDLDHMEVIDLAWCKATILTMPLEKQQVVKTWFQTMVYVDGNIDPRETEVINQIFSSRQINI